MNSIVPKEAIEVIAQSIGVTNLSPDVSMAFAPDVEYRVREIMQVPLIIFILFIFFFQSIVELGKDIALVLFGRRRDSSNRFFFFQIPFCSYG